MLNQKTSLCTAALMLAVLPATHAASKYFNAGAGATTWDTTTLNWGSSPAGPFNTVAWVDYDFATFQGTGDAVTLSGTTRANGLTFLSNNYVLTGGTLVTGSPTGGTLINTGAGITTTIASNISMTSLGFSKTGAGTLNLTGVVAASGFPIKVTGGLLKVTGTGRLFGGAHATGSVTVQSGGVLELDTWHYNLTASSLGGLSNAAGSVVINAGTIRVNGTTTYGRGATLNGAATLEAAAGANWTIDTVNDNAAWVYNNNSMTLAGAGTGTFQKVFSGTGALSKTGNGTWTLSGANLHTGGTTINAGTLVAGHASALGTGAATLGGGTLQIGATNVTGIASLTVSAGTLDTSAGAITTTGAFSLFGGTWKIGAAADSLTAGSFVLDSGIIDISALTDKTTGANGFSLIGGLGTVNAGSISFTGGDSGFNYALDTAGDLVVTAIPEPATGGLIAASALTVFAFGKRRRRAIR